MAIDVCVEFPNPSELPERPSGRASTRTSDARLSPSNRRPKVRSGVVPNIARFRLELSRSGFLAKTADARSNPSPGGPCPAEKTNDTTSGLRAGPARAPSIGLPYENAPPTTPPILGATR